MRTTNDMPGHLVRRFQQAAVAIFYREVAATGYDLSPVQFAALTAVRDNPGIDQATLAGLIAYDRTTIGGVVDRLVQKGFLERKHSARDRRARVLRLTATGQGALQRIEPAVEEAQRVMLQGLDAEEAAQFMALLRKALGAVNELSRAPLKEVKRPPAAPEQPGG
ncbi:MarR family transcriptional regulator [Psychromarinibacter sp. C21-152]|uniref:MarR family transcriptional regulator n=1 Tax=Psychromarinibacter sediminicola TaxID=3033385 RepID=A0AAE3T971_9RHOB|nr:MarR family transcriptional regulator [Psychromarinibacter sediminicola]MDF0600714.1 MarR family transcriptional regulator [Psychromarinibacter sediminicola]